MRQVAKSEMAWRQVLTPGQYHIVREKGTEPPFSGQYHDHHEPGVYRCVACQQPLFSSKTKFDSGTGWPSFKAPIKKASLDQRPDRDQGLIRSEAVCVRCGAHLGHVFDDGPPPTGKRYCINSLALDFAPGG